MIDQDGNPHFKLYYFLSSNIGEKVLREGRIKLTDPARTNDPFEFLPARFDEELRDTCDLIQLEIVRSWKILCLSRSIDNPALWGHYADCHKGMSLEFKIPIKSINVKIGKREKIIENKKEIISFLKSQIHKVTSIDTSIFIDQEKSTMTLNKVIYSDLRVDLLKCDYSEMLELVYRKDKSWSFEDEWRAFIAKGFITDIEDNNYFISDLMPYLSKIILGIRSPLKSSDIENILASSSWKRQNQEVEIVHAGIKTFHFKVSIP